MAKQTINIGQSANDKRGDPLRTAFNKVNENFTELYSSIGSATNGNWLFDGDNIKNLNGGVIGNGDATHGDTAILSLPVNGSGDIELGNLYGAVVLTTGVNPDLTKGYVFTTTGTIAVPPFQTRTFTAVLDSAHMINAVGFTDVPWEFVVEFQVAADGTVTTVITNNTPFPDNPGYVNGYTFRFTQDDHGIPDYLFDIILTDIQHPGDAGWTTNLAVNQPPNYPETIFSNSAIKLQAGNHNLTFGTDGSLKIDGGDVGGGGTGWDLVRNNTSLGIDSSGNIRTSNNGTGVIILADGAESIDIKSSSHAELWYNRAWSPASEEDPAVNVPANNQNTDAYIWVAEDGVSIENYRGVDDAHGYTYTWNFGTDGNLHLPENGGIVDSTGTSVLGSASLGDFTITDRLIASTTQGNVILRALGPGGAPSAPPFEYDWTFTNGGRLQMPVGGDIVDSTGTSVLGGGNTADTGFIVNAIYNPNGMILENADLSLSATAAISIPSNGNPSIPISIQNNYGQVTITTGTDPETLKVWTFGDNGKTTFPQTTVPTHSYGGAGDKAGMVALDGNHFYYCKQDYVNNTTDIWVRSVWTDTNW